MSRSEAREKNLDRFNMRYINGDLPWDIGRPDFNLTSFVSLSQLKPCKVIDIGCGTGDSVIWLAQMGFEVTGVDLSETAIEMAKEKMVEKGVKCKFLHTNFLEEKLSEKFDFVFDRGCFHSFETEGRVEFSKAVSDMLVAKGIWLSVMGNLDDGARKMGPPQLRATEIVTAVEPDFEIISLESKYFDSKTKVVPKSWVGLYRKREEN